MIRPRCFLPAWLFGWVVAVFLPSALIAYLGLSVPAAAIGTGFDHLPATAWKVADDVGPVAKLMLGGMLLVLFYGVARFRAGGVGAAVAGLVAMAGALAFVPAYYSRGFGLGLTGMRFDPAILPWYAIGAVLGGVTFWLSFERCHARTA